VRAGRRLATDLNAEWYVLFIETPGHLNMPLPNRQRIQHNLQLAEQLGARVVSLPGKSRARSGHRFRPRAQYYQNHRR